MAAPKPATRAAAENTLADNAEPSIAMSQPTDDDGTVIRSSTVTLAAVPDVTSPGQAGAGDRRDFAGDGVSLPIGTRLGEFEITQRIGEGGFSIVYLGMDHSLERTVALKEYMPSSLAARVSSTQVRPRSERHRDTFEAGLKSFVNEAKLLASFDHPSLVKVYRFWEANGTAYMAMPFYQGVTVKDAIRAMPDRPDEAWLLALLAPLTEALMVIHAERCYHRDIAPDNVILLAGSSRPLLLDFGAARRVIGDMTQGLTVILKAGYAPVEQYAEVPGMKQGPWTDVYALAAVVYWAVTGATPPVSIGRMMGDSFVPLAECAAGRYSVRFLQTIDRALVVPPKQRTQSIADFRRDRGLADEANASPPLPWSDSDTTVIRPKSESRGPPTSARPKLPEQSVHSADAGQPARQPAPQDVAARPVSADGAATRTRTRQMVLLAIATTAVVATAGIWWAVQKPSAESSRPVHGTDAGASDRRQAVTPGGADTPGADMPVTGGPSAASSPAAPGAEVPSLAASVAPVSSPAASATEVPSAVITEAAKPVAASPRAPTESIPGTSPARVAKKSAPSDTGATQPDHSAERAAQRPDAVARPEHAIADSANRAECSRIFQRLSLGESSAELMDRLKSLKCQ
jgi:serine/threonine protein kinase